MGLKGTPLRTPPSPGPAEGSKGPEVLEGGLTAGASTQGQGMVKCAQVQVRETRRKVEVPAPRQRPLAPRPAPGAPRPPSALPFTTAWPSDLLMPPSAPALPRAPPLTPIPSPPCCCFLKRSTVLAIYPPSSMQFNHFRAHPPLCPPPTRPALHPFPAPANTVPALAT